MTGAPYEGQSIPVRIHRTDDHLVLATPMAGLTAQDISVAVAGEMEKALRKRWPATAGGARGEGTAG